jgi:hypothetical protein
MITSNKTNKGKVIKKSVYKSGGVIKQLISKQAIMKKRRFFLKKKAYKVIF